jgi:hypothetical protein
MIAKGFIPEMAKILRDHEWVPNCVAYVVAGPNVISSAASEVRHFVIAKDLVRLGVLNPS